MSSPFRSIPPSLALCLGEMVVSTTIAISDLRRATAPRSNSRAARYTDGSTGLTRDQRTERRRAVSMLGRIGGHRSPPACAESRDHAAPLRTRCPAL